ncbi:MAG: TetR family transcriptional regulator [Actinophytocola sp.]|uniref:TetR/AcrR family transcriptional regulator n=1 Tax=Actinophytocola sp. TaxID=1872138 RepID=UPI003C7358AE
MTSRAVLREEQKTATRHRVLDAAVRVFTETPFVAASVADVAAAAGVTRVTVYAHFPDGKADLVRGLIARVYATADRLYADLADAEWTRDTIRDWVATAAAAWRRLAPTIRVVTTTGAIAREPGDRGQYVEAHERYVALLSSGSRWDGVVAAEAGQRVLMAVLQVESVLTVWAVGAWPPAAEPLDLLADAVCHLFAPALDNEGRNRR